MSIVTSRDGTTIAYEGLGSGPPLILIDGALCHRGRCRRSPCSWQVTPRSSCTIAGAEEKAATRSPSRSSARWRTSPR